MKNLDLINSLDENKIPDLLKCFFPFDELTLEKKKYFFRCIFKDYRYDGENHLGKRLTLLGLELFCNNFKSYDLKISDKKILLKYIVFLNKNCNLPFYIEKGRFIIFESELAMKYKLSSNSLEEFCDSFQELSI